MYGGCDPVDMGQLIGAMEAAAPVRALSISVTMLPAALELILNPRISSWHKRGKPYIHRWPRLVWEPIVLWGDLPTFTAKPGVVPPDSLVVSAGGKTQTDFPAPKPDSVCNWILNLIGANVGDSRPFLDIFSGSGSMTRAAARRGFEAVGIDLQTIKGAWTGDPSSPVVGYEPAEPCPAALAGYPEFRWWWTAGHVWQVVYYRAPRSADTRWPTANGFRVCVGCDEIRDTAGRRVTHDQVRRSTQLFKRWRSLSGRKDFKKIPGSL